MDAFNLNAVILTGKHATVIPALAMVGAVVLCAGGVFVFNKTKEKFSTEKEGA